MSTKKIVAPGQSMRTEISLRSTRTEIVFKDGQIVVDTFVRKETSIDERYPLGESQKLPTTREHARSVSSTRFFTGVACLYGHLAPRMTSNNQCVECLRLRALNTDYGVKAVKKNNKTRQDKNREYRELIKAAPGKIYNLNERELTDRMEAARQGKAYYFDPLPCKRGHAEVVRYTNSGVCVACNREDIKRSEDKKYLKGVVIDNANLLSNPTVVIF